MFQQTVQNIMFSLKLSIIFVAISISDLTKKNELPYNEVFLVSKVRLYSN